jgi:hypothetical protein
MYLAGTLRWIRTTSVFAEPSYEFTVPLDGTQSSRPIATRENPDPTLKECPSGSGRRARR